MGSDSDLATMKVRLVCMCAWPCACMGGGVGDLATMTEGYEDGEGDEEEGKEGHGASAHGTPAAQPPRPAPPHPEPLQAAAAVLEEFGVALELTVVSAHRTPERMFEYARTAHSRGLKVSCARGRGRAVLRCASRGVEGGRGRAVLRCASRGVVRWDEQSLAAAARAGRGRLEAASAAALPPAPHLPGPSLPPLPLPLPPPPPPRPSSQGRAVPRTCPAWWPP
jgi:hypothetical protein